MTRPRPQHLGGESALYGALLVETLTLSGEASVHYDEQPLDVWGGYVNNP